MPGAVPAPPVRLHAFLSGWVQGVGMRYTVRELAQARGLTGWVRNLSDGRVELVAEGPRADLDDFLLVLRADMARHIQQVDAEWSAATGEWRDFRVARF